MMLRPLHLVLIALLLVLQGQLWFGRGSIPDVMRLRQTLKDQKQQNAAAQLANDRLSAELHDLKDGLVKPNEVFVQIAK
jgi:cell division protein FtsB